MNNSNRGNSNSNSNNNNRRRGRSNRPGGGSGGQPLNRIDSRARGNASQLLEKYRKLAHDAHLNGDRVQSEYYLQFADHYFRVVADSRVRQEEGRGRAPGESWQSGEDGEDSGEFTSNSDFPNFDQPSYNRAPREERPRDDRPREERPRHDDNRVERAPRPAQVDQEDSVEVDAVEANPFEPAKNPFVQESRTRPGLRPRRESRPRPLRQVQGGREDDGDNASAGLDPASLPPAISASRSDAVDDGADDAEVKPRKRAPRRKPSAGDAGETLESVN